MMNWLMPALMLLIVICAAILGVGIIADFARLK